MYHKYQIDKTTPHHGALSQPKQSLRHYSSHDHLEVGDVKPNNHTLKKG